MPNRDGWAPGPPPSAPAPWGLCCVRVSVPGGGLRVGPVPQICSVLPRNAGWRPALWCLCPCINGSGFVAWFSCMFLFKRPSFGFPLLQAPAAEPPRSPPRGCRGRGPGGIPGLAFAFTVVTKNVRVAFLFYPVAPSPGGALAPRALVWGRRGGQLGWGPLLYLVSSFGHPNPPKRMREPLRPPASPSPSGAGAAWGRCEGTQPGPWGSAGS